MGDTEPAPLLPISGELSVRSAAGLQRQFTDALAQGHGMVLDLAGVEACDTAALQLLCSLRKTALQRGLKFAVVAVSPAVEETAAALGLSIQELTGGVAGVL